MEGATRGCGHNAGAVTKRIASEDFGLQVRHLRATTLPIANQFR